MKKNELASIYMSEYDDTDVIIVNVAEGDGWVAYDTSDGRHWVADDCTTGETENSLCDAEITYDGGIGWLANGEEIAWVG